MKTKNLTKMIITFVLLASLAVVSIAGWLTNTNTSNPVVTVGEVSVQIEAYFEYYDEFDVLQTKTTDIEYEYTVDGQGTFTKFGIYRVNLSNPDDPQFIKNLRVNIDVLSNVESYMRIGVYEQLTLSYISGGKSYEVAITQPTKMPFNYMDTNDMVNPYFYDNRDNDGFFYYTNTVKRNPDTTPQEITFVADFGSTPFNLYDASYSLQLGFIIEAVQSIEGPVINWGLPNRPWDDGAW
ncbi:hypothetical protein [Paracholeplasma manati]|uniref:Uncharacterized protein n=1 Tax=Paracholeplasma manati TaxID=591373 RepID=A0ABT2Y5G2_9MOLU|nr:hypothetical protein [Paracholeplasma manati]MCV2231980.1 hypothetical protein [Paracholeplasma manati]MDG0888866.1 hypothetical protein [Paracholeplasma manati]